MIGKIIAHGRNRNEAIMKLKNGLTHGIRMRNQYGALLAIIGLESFHGDEIITTNYINNNLNNILKQFEELTAKEIAIAALIALKENACFFSKSRQKISRLEESC